MCREPVKKCDIFSMSYHNGLVFFPEISFIITRMYTIHVRLYFHFLKYSLKGAGTVCCFGGSRSESVPMTSCTMMFFPVLFAECSEEFRGSSMHNSHSYYHDPLSVTCFKHLIQPHIVMK